MFCIRCTSTNVDEKNNLFVYLKHMSETDRKIEEDGKESLLLKIDEEGNLLTEEQRKIRKESGVAVVCKWCEKQEWVKDSLYVFDVERFKKLIPEVRPWEAYHCFKCPRCNWIEGFKFTE